MHPSTTPARRRATGGWLIAALVIGALLGITVDRAWSPDRRVVERPFAPRPAQAPDETVADDDPAVEVRRVPIASEATRGGDVDTAAGAPERLDSNAAHADDRPRLPVELRVVLPDGTAASDAEITIRREEDDGDADAPKRRHAWTPSRATVELPLGTSFLAASGGATLRSGERSITLHPGDRERRLTLALREKSELHGRLRLSDPNVHAGCTIVLAEVPRAWRPEFEQIAATLMGRLDGPRQQITPPRTTFVFTDLEPGRRLVVVRRVDSQVARTIDLVPGRNEIEIDLPPIEEGRLLHVRVRSEAGHALRDVKFAMTWRPAGSDQLHFYGIDGDGVATGDDGTYSFLLDETLQLALRGEAKGLLELKAAAPDHAERSTPLETGKWRYELVLPAEPTHAFTVQLAGDRDALDRGLFRVELRRYADAGRRAWSGSLATVDATGHALFDRVLPGRTSFVLFVRGASFLPEVLLAEQELVVDAACTTARFEVPPLHDLMVAVPPSADGDEDVKVAAIDRSTSFEVETRIDATRRARFFALPAGRYSISSGARKTTIDLADSIEITLASGSGG